MKSRAVYQLPKISIHNLRPAIVTQRNQSTSFHLAKKLMTPLYVKEFLAILLIVAKLKTLLGRKAVCNQN